MKLEQRYIPIQLRLAAIFIFLITLHGTAQVSIGNTTPEGALELKPTIPMGMVYPRVALTKSNIAAPVVNPNGGTLVSGTVVYNTQRTQTGANDVYPGIYVWDTNKWVPQFVMEEYAIFKQTGGDFRTTKTGTGPNANVAQNIPGLTNVVFTPTYSGLYKIKVNTNFGAGVMTNYFTDDNISAATAEGDFLFKIIGSGVSINPAVGGTENYATGWIYTHSFGVYNNVSGGVVSDKVAQYSSGIWTRYLTAGMPYTFTLSINIYTGSTPQFASGLSGQGHVGLDIPCSVEFTLVNEQ